MLKYVTEICELLDDPAAGGGQVCDLLKERGLEQVGMRRVQGALGSTDFLQVGIPGKSGKTSSGAAPSLGIIGRLGGIGARPSRTGMVSDADGAVVAVACALKLADMRRKGDLLEGDVLIATHICPRSPVIPHQPVPFMGSPVEMREMNRNEVSPLMDAILSVDATKGNRIANWRGVAITPTVKQGYILRVSEDLLDLLSWTTGRPPRVVPITTQDITPYGNGLFHMNSILQPATATDSPVVGVALTSEVAVPGCATGANQAVDLDEACRFCLEVAKAFSSGICSFYDGAEFEKMVRLYGSMSALQTTGRSLSE